MRWAPSMTRIIARALHGDAAFIGWRFDHRLRRHHANVGVIGQFGSTAARPLAEVALRVGLHAPRDLADEVSAVACARSVAVQLGVPLGQFAGGMCCRASISLAMSPGMCGSFRETLRLAAANPRATKPH